MSKLLPIAFSNPTGANSVVLNMKAATASAPTLIQLARCVSAGVLIEPHILIRAGALLFAHLPVWTWTSAWI
jgi:hypothetical protein